MVEGVRAPAISGNRGDALDRGRALRSGAPWSIRGRRRRFADDLTVGLAVRDVRGLGSGLFRRPADTGIAGEHRVGPDFAGRHSRHGSHSDESNSEVSVGRIAGVFGAQLEFPGGRECVSGKSQAEYGSRESVAGVQEIRVQRPSRCRSAASVRSSRAGDSRFAAAARGSAAFGARRDRSGSRRRSDAALPLWRAVERRTTATRSASDDAAMRLGRGSARAESNHERRANP